MTRLRLQVLITILLGITAILSACNGGDVVPDTAAPSVPVNLIATVVSASEIDLSWSPATDNVGVNGYRVYRDGSEIAITITTDHRDGGLSSGTRYCYSVSAYDAAGNVSALSGRACATTAPPAAPTIGVTYDIKQFVFRWNSVSEATHYRLLENPDGVSGFSPVGEDLPPTTTTKMLDIAVHRHDWPNARYLLEACNAIGCTASNEVFTLSGMLQTIGYLKASNTEPEGYDYFGSAVALSGDGLTLAVSAFGESSAATGINGNQADNSVPRSGAVYVFTHSAGSWSQQAYIKASNTGSGDDFGTSVALSRDGTTLAIGARGEDSAATGVNGDQANDTAPNAGAAYVFTRNGSSWTQQAYVKASNTEAQDEFGSQVALSGDGNTLAVNAREDSAATGINGNQADNNAPGSGAVYVFTRSGSTWAQQAYIKASNTDISDAFGGRLALSDDGNTLAVTALGEASAATGINGNQADNSAPDAGAAYVFTRTGSTWAQQAYVKASNTEASPTDFNDYFGASVALSGDGNILAVGAWSEDSAATGINGNESDNSVPYAGAAYVYTRNGSTLTQQAYVKASNTGTKDYFGGALALSGDGKTLAVKAHGERSSATGVNGNQVDDSVDRAGAVYVFSWNGSTWSQQSYVKASNTDQDDTFGNPSLSTDGSTLAIGVGGEDSSAVGIGGDQMDNSATSAGAVYLY